MTDLLALAATQTNGFQTAWEFLEKGGIFMIPLGITSVAGVMAILYKFLSLASSRIVPPALAREIEKFSQNARPEAVIRQFDEGKSTLARMSAVAVRNQGKSRADITHAVESAAREEIVHLHAGISVLDSVITIAPLLGLIGTASGLVKIFQGLSDNSDHLAIAQGIAEALTTTIIGLVIAVPCVIAHGYFTRRIEKLTARLESLLSQLTSACEKPSSNA